jgi:transcriptional regulator with XRE-family HTH domain
VAPERDPPSLRLACAYRSHNRRVYKVTTIARCAGRDRVLIQSRLASQLRGRRTPARPAPRWVAPAFNAGPPSSLVGTHIGNGEQHWTMPSPHPIDVHVGLRIRQRRRFLDMSQEKLGVAIGLTFQMVQKYEIGSNSVPASRLVEVAKALDVPPSFFFEGPRLRAKMLLHTRETIELVRAYFMVRNPRVRESIAETIQAIAVTALSNRRRS